MSDALTANPTRERAQKILDWGVFSLGAASLTFAITATLFSHFELGESSPIEAASDTITVTVLPDVL